MKRIVPVTLAIAATFLAMSTRSQAEALITHAVVPFTFSIGTKNFPAGTYNIVHHGAFVQFQSPDGRNGTILAPTAGSTSIDGRSRLLFDLSNHRYFLRRIVTPFAGSSMDFPKSLTEKQAEESVERVYASASTGRSSLRRQP